MELLQQFFLCFIPLFVAIDIIAVLPLFWTLTGDMEPKQKALLVTQASFTALVVAVIFLFSGKLLFSFLGINEHDFRVAGGIILLIISISDVISSQSDRKKLSSPHIGVVPIGIPLIMGPAALTSIIILVDTYGYAMVLLSILVNMALVWIFLRKSAIVLRLLGESGAMAFGKVMSLFLAAIAVMMIRVGLTHFFP